MVEFVNEVRFAVRENEGACGWSRGWRCGMGEVRLEVREGGAEGGGELGER